jgi:hypothetical protein
MATVANVTTVVTERCSSYLAKARALSGSGSIPDIAHAIGWGVRMLGYTTAGLTTVTDGEVGAVSSDKLDALCDLAELRTLESIQTNLTAVNVTAGPLQEDLGSLAERLGEIVTERRKNIATRYSAWLAAPLTDESPKRASLRVL